MNSFHRPEDKIPEPFDRSGAGLGTPPTWLSPPPITTVGRAFNDFTNGVVLTGSSADPSLGNAVVHAHYIAIGKLIHFSGIITFGSSSTYGTGSYRLKLPVQMSTDQSNIPIMGSAYLYDSSSGNAAQGTALLYDVTHFNIAVPATYLGSHTLIGTTAPWTWAASDQIAWMLTYESE